HLLRRHVQGDRPQVDLDHPVDDRDEQEETGPLRRSDETAEPEDDTPLVLARDLHSCEQEDQDEDDDDDEDNQCGCHWRPFSEAIARSYVLVCGLASSRAGSSTVVSSTGRTASMSPSSSASTSTSCPGRSGSSSGVRARQSSPRTATKPS